MLSGVEYTNKALKSYYRKQMFSIKLFKYKSFKFNIYASLVSFRKIINKMIGKQHEYDVMAECEKDMWWFKNLHETTLSSIEKYSFREANILDAGCGTGGMLSFLYNKGYLNLKGFDLSSDAVNHTKNKTSFDVQLLSVLECSKYYPIASFDVIIFNDILVLLKDSDARIAFENLISLLKPGGLLLTNNAVGKAFKGTHDVACEMLRRYSKKDIDKLAKEHGTEIIKHNYWPFLLSPIILLVRLLGRIQISINKNKNFKSDVKMPPKIINNFFYNLTKFEINNLSKKPWGSSLHSVIRKSI